MPLKSIICYVSTNLGKLFRNDDIIKKKTCTSNITLALIVSSSNMLGDFKSRCMTGGTACSMQIHV